MDNQHYTPKQMEYIDSVGGNAHISAVEIIGKLEAEIAGRIRSKPGDMLLIESATQWAITESREASDGNDYYATQADEWESALEQFIQ